MRATSFSLSADLYRRLNFAAAGMGLSSSEYIRRALVTVMAVDAVNDPALGAAFSAMQEFDRQESEASQEKVPA